MARSSASSARVPAEVLDYCAWLAATLERVSGITGVYLHGSAAMGGWNARTSDVDVLAVVAGRLTSPEGVAEAITRGRPAPGAGLETSVVSAGTLLVVSEAPRFELHVTTGHDQKVVADVNGDPDLVMHYAVCRERGLAIAGPPPATVFPAVPRRMLLAAFAREVEWGLEHAPARYAALNACRAWAYAFEGRLLSKVEGAEWALSRGIEPGLVRAALEAQEGAAEPREPEALKRLAAASRAALLAALGE